ncbi:SDR family NAD(P)-dependent oxidoreductase [Streptomyces sp. NPDC001604]|uniref:SDR family NAD(P)-dependent oxidoreductase n=1 Tax=Streptomyces sp. NPDC001604 TaxID=3364593 RepID=UPI0036A4DDB6
MTGTPDKLLDALRASVKETERLRQRNRQLVEASSAPVAIVGMSCRLPGGVTSPEELWELLGAGGDAISGFPTDRGWDTESVYDPDPDHQGTSYVVEGGFLDGAADFDAGLFGISPREALAMDPQQRLLLEASWEALERAGVAPASLRGSTTGVFVGVAPTDYVGHPGLRTVEGIEGHLTTGGAASVMSGRISYLLGLQGPAVSIDTACSSSLVALHIAAQAVRSGECSLALVGGVTVMASPLGFIGFSRQRGLAEDGRCKAFSADADGMGMGEGVGMLVLERLSDAQRNGHPVLAVIRGSAVNQDGASNGMTAPNGPSQQRVIRAALANAHVAATDVDVVEAHGTGTALGDPIEAQALLATYGQDRPEDRPLWLGSVKSNIGHPQQAAGVAGVIKMVLALQHEELPRTLHADEPSPHIDWTEGHVRLLTEARPWQPGERPRRAGVSSFGISGTNAHVILEEAPAAEPVEPSSEVEPVVSGVGAWLVSSRSAAGLSAQADRLREWVTARPELQPADVAWSLATSRSVFEHRAVVLGAEGLGALAGGAASGDVVSGVARSGVRPVFVFPGQGSQWLGMGCELAAASPVFAARLAECAAALAPHVEWSLMDVLAGVESAPALEAADVVQPVLWAVMVSLAAVWEAAGVAPAAVVGHSQGEIAAATVAGMLSLEDGARVVALRSRSLKVLAGAGGMLSVAASAEVVEGRLGEQVALAAVNGPAAVVVSGEPQALEELKAQFEAEGIRARMVAVDYASHGPQVDRLEAEIREVLAGISPRRGRVPMVSSMSGETLTGEELDAGYWYDSLRNTVHFDPAVRTLADQGHQVFIEVSPHPVLTGAITDTLEEVAEVGAVPGAVCGTLRRDDDSAARIVTSLAEAWVQGASVDWTKVLPAADSVELPTYAFQHERYWPKAVMASGGDASSLGLGSLAHPLLSAVVELADGAGVVCTGRLSVRSHPWLADHRVGGVTLLPGTGFVELAVQAGDMVGCGVLEELTLQAPLVVPDGGAGVQVQVAVGSEEVDGRRSVEVYSRTDGAGETWIRHATGVLVPTGRAVDAGEEFTVWPPSGAEAVDVGGMYEALAAASYEYGPVFQGLKAVWRRDGDVFAEVELAQDEAAQATAFGLHPALLDAVLQAGALAETPGGAAQADAGEVRLPFAWTGVELHATGATVLRARIRRDAQGSLSFTAVDVAGAPVVSVASLITRAVTAEQLRSAGTESGLADALFAMDWVPVPESAPGVPVGEWALVGADRFGLVEALADTGVQVRPFADLAELAEAAEFAPGVVLACAGTGQPAGADAARAAQEATGEALALVQRWLGEERFEEARLVVVTRGGVAASGGEGVVDLAAAAARGLLRSAQSENPGRIVLADLPADGAEARSAALLPSVLDSGEPELALRDTVAYGRRLTRPSGELVAPEGVWRLTPDETGSLEGLRLAAAEDVDGPLPDGWVRIAVRAAGLNFRDVLIGLGMYPGGGVMGSEVAGVVTETGPAVSGLAVGDRVMGVAAGGFGPLAVTDARQVVRIPDGWSFTDAASVPVAFMTAWYALVELAGVRAGQRVLIHAGAGGVGMAAVQIARHLGAEVFATASPAKWPVLERMGLDAEHIASSRDAGFEAAFAAVTGGAGVDVVVNSLAGELIDASLRLLPRGGAFVEMGATDLRDADAVAAEHPGVTYRPFNLAEAGPEGLGEMLGRISALMAEGALSLLPVRAWDVRRAREAFRFMSQAKHTGKIVLTIPSAPHTGAASALVTGGTGTLGALVARHLVDTGRADSVVLTSRSGAGAPGVAELAARLAESGASVRVAACDAADRDALATLLAGLPAEAPLRTVIHTAGVLDDGTIGSLTADRVASVMRPKADGAWNLHELTRHLDLDHFALFSSGSSAFSSPGQGNYVAANAFLDALATRRRADGLPASSLAWGLWADTSALTGQLTEAERARMNRGGAVALSAEEGLALLDAALARDEAVLVPARWDIAGMRAQAARSVEVPPLWRALVGAGTGRRAAASGNTGAGADSLRRQLAAMAEQDCRRLLMDLVRTHAAAVLGHAAVDAIAPTRAFTDLGFDSLTAVEMRNRLTGVTGLRLPATLVFDYPNPIALAGHLLAELVGDGTRLEALPPVRTTMATDDEPIAIVGMACRFPGDADDPDAFWQLLASGKDAISDFPDDRGWDEGLYDPDPDKEGTVYTRSGGFISDARGFDADFFGISPREALAMDPQQRLLLEVSWEALERAGIDPETLRGSQSGVFVGGFASSYGLGVAAGAEGHATTGFATSVMSGRVSYTLGLEGPALTVDTACSSSLVALHLAVQALRGGECTMALAGGSTVIASPEGIIGFSRQRGLAEDGRCKAFSAQADGMGFAEGAGMLVVERLSDARRNGHPVLAVVRGSAVNQDGASNGLTAPNGPSQQRVIRAALADARLTPADVDVVEAHGTGTTLGDPIEAQALLATYGQDRPEDRPLWLGSVKSNIGHTQAAAGVAGVMKLVLALQHGELPPTLHADEASPHIDWSAGEVSLLTEPVEWPAGERVRRGGVSSFGISGTNAHVIVEEAPAAEPVESSGGVEPVVSGASAWLVSARTAAGLAGQADRLREWVAARPELEPADVAWSLATSRSVFEHRAVVLGAEGLGALAGGMASGDVVSGVARSDARTVFVFPGQGSQWLGMGCELAETSPVFVARLAECAAALAPHVEWSLMDVLAGAEGAPALEAADVVQPVLWAVMVSLAAVWEAAGVAPAAVVGHSQGEIAAATVAGMLSLEDAARVVALRSRSLKVLAGAGGMLSVAASAEVVEGRLDERLSLAAVNGPAAVVVSGEPQALEELKAQFEAEGIRARMVAVDYASHGPQVDRLEAEIREALAGISPRRGRVPMVSSMSGETLTGEELDAGYWYDSLRNTVHFERAVRTLADQGHPVFIEVSPHPVLFGAMTDTLEEVAGAAGPGAVPGAVCGTLRRDDDSAVRIVTSLAEAWVQGASVDWTKVLPVAERTELPTYAFQHESFWPKAGVSSGGDASSLGLASLAHPLLGAAVELADGAGVVCTGRLSVRSQPWLADHRVGGVILLPGTGFVELAVQAGDQVGCGVLEELTLQAPLVVPESGAVQVQVVVASADDGRRSVEVYSRTDGAAESWVRHAEGVLAPTGQAVDAGEEFAVWPPSGASAVDIGGMYRAPESSYQYGPVFQGLKAVWRRDGDVFAEVALPESVVQEAGAFVLHPALLDAVLQASGLAEAPGGAAQDDAGEVRLPFAWTGVELHAAGATVLRARIRRDAQGSLNLAAVDAAGAPVVSVASLITRAVTADQLRSAGTESGLADALFAVEWAPLAESAALTGEWALIGADRFGLVEALAGTGVQVRPFAGLAELSAAAEAREIDPQAVLVCAGEPEAADGDAARAARYATGEALALAQDWLAEERLESARLVVVTRGGVAASPGERVADLAAAASRGLWCSAQAEHPDRIVLVDLPADGADERSAALLPSVLDSGEPELALRGEAAYGRRLTRASVAGTSVEHPHGPRVAPSVLVTGGTGTLGGLVARHLVTTGRADGVVLTSRSGPAAADVPALAAELAGLGAAVDVVACDAADRDALASVLAAIPAERPLRSVVHAAGVLDDGVIAALTPERLDTVMRPKADAAWHLHELTRDLELDHFVLFSSAAATFGVAGQGNYVAANAFLDALAVERRAAGLPGTSLAWGLWADTSALTGQLTEAARSRMSRVGALSAAEGLALFDVAVARDEAVLVPVRMDLADLRARAARSGEIPALWRTLGGAPARRGAASGSPGADSLRRQLAALSPADADEMLLDLVRAQVAVVLGHASGDAVEPGRAFNDLGFDSLTAVQLRNRLGMATGLRLPATLVFDYPNPIALAAHLSEKLGGGTGASAAAAQPAPVAATDEPIAIVGLSCRFPGGVDGPEDLWRLLAEGRDAVTTFPADRGWDLDGLYDPDAEHLGTSYTRAGGFLDDASAFDAGFFGISPKEALAMDPQQRLLLELSWEAFERAGIDPVSLRGSRTGAFMGGYTSGYELSVLADPDSGAEGHLMTGIATSILSGRVAYALGLEGPTMTVDTACSSALVALHLAAQALRSGECSLAVAGGVTVMATPGTFVEFSRQRGLAPDGRCKAFAADADGTGFAEGAGLLVVERLSDARRNGRRVLAVLRGSAINQDGASNGLTAPNGPSQQRVIRAALANAGLRADEIDAVEAHGTGTTLGDPIEAQAVLATYGQNRPQDRPAWLGTVKSNIGHTQAAAGAAGVIKMVLALQHGLLPATLHVDEPSPHIDWTEGHVQLLTEARPWPAGERPRRAGVSSFGISGTNAHVVLEEAPAPQPPANAEPAPVVVPWVLAGRTDEALRAQAARLRAFLADRPDVDPADVGRTLALRTAFDHRAVVLGEDRESLLVGLAMAAAGVPARNVLIGTATGEGKALFFFPGDAADEASGEGPGNSPGNVPGWLASAARLLDESPVFAASMAECAMALAPFTDWKLSETVRGGSGAAAVDRPEVRGPVQWAVMVSLAALWRSAGVRPAAVAGHGVGEIAAAQAGGVLSLADAARIAVLTTRIAGAPDPADLAVIAPRTQDVPVFSGRDAAWIDGTSMGAGHWCRPPRPAAPAAELAEALAEGGYGICVEVGPSLASTAEIGRAPVAADDPSRSVAVVATLRGDGSALGAVTAALAAAHVRGVAVDWPAVLGRGQHIDLPTYAFQHQRFWPAAPRPAATPPAAAPGEDRFWTAVEGGDLAALASVLGVDEPLREDMPLSEVLAGLTAWRRRESGDGRPGGPAGDEASADTLGWLRRLLDLPSDKRLDLLVDLLRGQFAELLGYETAEQIRPDADVFELGMTSMTAVQLQVSLIRQLGVQPPEGFVYDYYSPAALADFLSEILPASLAEADPGPEVL